MGIHEIQWATEAEALEEFRSRTFPGRSPVSGAVEALKEMQVEYYIDRARKAQQKNEQQHDVQLGLDMESPGC